jgi:putative flippase GtrA
MKGKYLIVGLGVYLIELVVIIVAQHLGASPLLAVGLSFWIGLIISFGLQKFVTFGDGRTHYKIVLKQVISVGILVLFNFGFTILCTKLLSSMLPVFIIRAGIIGVTSIWNFYLYKTHIFHRVQNLPIQ